MFPVVFGSGAAYPCVSAQGGITITRTTFCSWLRPMISLVGIFSLLPANALACSCRQFDAQVAFNRASYVFTAYIDEAKLVSPGTPVGDWDTTGPFAVARYRVSRTWKGQPRELDGVVSHADVPTCGIPFTVGREYVFFVYEAWEPSGWFGKSRYGIVTRCGNPYQGHEVYDETMRWLEQMKH